MTEPQEHKRDVREQIGSTLDGLIRRDATFEEAKAELALTVEHILEADRRGAGASCSLRTEVVCSCCRHVHWEPGRDVDLSSFGCRVVGGGGGLRRIPRRRLTFMRLFWLWLLEPAPAEGAYGTIRCRQHVW